MFNLFEKHKLFEVVTSKRQETIRLAAFGHVRNRPEDVGFFESSGRPEDDDEEDENEKILNYSRRIRPSTFVVRANLALYSNEYRFILYQFGSRADQIDREGDFRCQDWWRRFTIPFDRDRGHPVAMELDRGGTRLLVVTAKSYIYVIPFRMAPYWDQPARCERTVIEEDATVIKSCSIKNPTCIVWWEKDPNYAVERRLTAIVASEKGLLSFVDLETHEEFKRTSVPFPLRKLEVFDEMCQRSLLVTCCNGFQYQMVLEEFREGLKLDQHGNSRPGSSHSNHNSSNTTQKHSGSSSSTASCQKARSSPSRWNNYYLSCLLNLPIEADQDEVLAKTSPNRPNDIEWKPKLITFNNEIDINSLLSGANSMDPTTAALASEFFVFADDVPVPKMAIHPPIPPAPDSAGIFILKQQKPKIKMSSTSSSKTESSSDSSNNNKNKNKNHEADSDDSWDAASAELGATSNQEFCDVSVSRDLVLEIYEYSVPEFCTKTILLSSAKLYLVSLGEQLEEEPKPVRKVIDCGFRFFLLVYPDRCLLVSKTFAEQKTSASGGCSPRSPLLLKKSDSGGSQRGSFRQRRKTNPTATNLPTMSVVEEFHFERSYVSPRKNKQNNLVDHVIEVFLLTTPRRSMPGLKEYLNQRLDQRRPLVFHDLESVVQQEWRTIETLVSEAIDRETVRIDEQFLIVTQTSVYVIGSRERSFGRYFHSEVKNVLGVVEQGDGQDGDIITRVKLLVDCFTHRPPPVASPKHLPLTGSSTLPNQSWQIWLSRSALLLIREFRDQLKSTPDNVLTSVGETPNQFQQIFRLFELSRTPRKRVVTSFNYFHFYRRAIHQLHKFFHTRILFEINEEERVYLADQMFHALLYLYLESANSVNPDSNSRPASNLSNHHFDSLNHNSISSPNNHSNLIESPRAGSCSKIERELSQFLYEYRIYYDSKRIVIKLVEANLFDLANYVALLTGGYLTLVQELLGKFSTDQPESVRSKLIDKLTSKHVTYALILSTDYVPGEGCRSVALIERYLHFVFTTLPHLSARHLDRLARVFDHSRLAVRLLINQTLFYCNQTYLCTTSKAETEDGFGSDGDSDSSLITSTGEARKSLLPVKRRDLVNLYLFVLLLSIRKRKMRKDAPRVEKFVKIFDQWLPAENRKYEEQLARIHRMPRPKLEVQNAEHWRLAAGVFCSVAYNAEQFVMWGRFQHYFSNSQVLVRKLSEAISPGTPDPEYGAARSVTQLKKPTANRFFSTVIQSPIQAIAAGLHHLLILTEHALFALGSSAFGQLGLGTRVLESRYPALVESVVVKMSKVVCGSYHSMALSQDGDLYTWGWALHGQLGHGVTEDQFTPKRVSFFVEVAKSKISDIAAGYVHSAALTTTGELYVFGDNSHGQLGFKASENRKSKFSVPQKFFLLEFSPIRLIGCGLFHTLALAIVEEDEDPDNSCEKLYCWGLDPKTWRGKMRTEKAALALAARSQHGKTLTVYDYAKMKEICLDQIPSGSSITKIVAGQTHSLLLTNQGQVFACGSGKEGQLGLQNSILNVGEDAFPVETLDEVKVVDIAVGACHSLALDLSGNVWAWGQNSEYQLTAISQATESDTSTSPTTATGTSGAPVHQKVTRLSALIRRASSGSEDQSTDSMVNRMMSLPKNNEFAPVKVWSVTGRPEPSSIERNIVEDDFTDLVVGSGEKEEASEADLQLEPQVVNILKTLVYYRHDLNYKSLVRRFERLEFYHFCSVLSHLLREYPNCFRFQLISLLRNTRLGLLRTPEVLCEQIFLLVQYFFSKCTTVEECCKLIHHLIEAWPEISELCGGLEFGTLLERVYLDESSSSNVFVGLTLLRMVQLKDEEEFRRRLQLTDEIMIRVVQRTEQLVRSRSQAKPEDELVSIQNLIDSTLDVKSLFQCDHVKEDEPTSGHFPLEIQWRDLLKQFDQNQNRDQHQQPKTGDSIVTNQLLDDEVIEIRIPSDFELTDDDNENEDSGMNQSEAYLLLFQCGHYWSERKFTTKFNGEKLPRNPEVSQGLPKTTIWEDSPYQKVMGLLRQRDLDGMQPLMEQLKCPDCYTL